MDGVRFDTGLSFVHSPQAPLLCSSPLLNQAAIQQAPQPVAHSCLDQLDFYGLLQRSPLIAQSLSLRQVSQLLDDEQTEKLTGTRLGAPLVQPDDVNRLEYNRLSREQQGITATVSDAIARTMQQLQQFAADRATTDQLRLAFGTVWDVGTAQELIKQIVSNGFSSHSDIKLEIRPTIVPGLQGAFTAQTNTIYLFEDFLAAHIGNPDVIAAVLLEEVGHYLDAQLNSTDSPGDEGAIFAALVQGHSLSEQTLANLKVEDDFATLVVNNQIVSVECAAANDNWANAFSLSGTTSSVSGNNIGATAQSGEPAQSGTINSVWWKWIAPRDGTFTVDTMGSSGNPYLSVSKGSSVNTLTVLGRQAGQQPMQITVQANTTYYVAVDGTDNTTGGVTLNYRFTANNVAPTDLRLSATQVSEGQPVGTLVGRFSTVDADADNTFSYRLVAGPGDEGNGLFTIVGHQLYTHHVFDYETQQRYSIRVQTQDNRGGTYEKVLTIAITDNVRDNFTSLIHAALATDTAAGGVNSDGITSEPTIQGTISEPHQLVSLRAGVDAMPTTAFANVLPELQADGSFRFSRARLEAIAGKRLSDGAHVVQLQATDGYGNTKSLAVSFTLDTTTPTFEVQGLIDGISWSTTERLKGQLKQIEPDVWMVYQFDDQGEMELLINADGTFNKLLAVPSQAGEHTLKVSSIDQAGNRQTKAFRFLVKPKRVAVDEDLLTSSSGDGGEGDGSGIDGGGSSSGGSGGNGGTGSGTTGSGSPAMEWWLYGGGNSSGSNGGSGSPPPPPPPPEAPPTYLEKVAIILDRALYSMGEEEETIHKKAALKNRITMLMELAAIVDHYQVYDQMEGVLHGIYDEAEETIQTRDEASERGVDLAIQLLEASDAVRTEVYQSALLTVVNQVWIDNQYPALSEDQQQQLVNGLLELGRTYAALKPTLAPDTATTTTPDFLDSLWRAQLPSDPSTPKPYEEIRAELQRGITALDTLLDGVEDPLGALRFVNNLVQAATNVESLSEEGTLDAQFLRELVAFGFEYAKLNPTPLATATEDGTEAFLATLWQSESTEAESIAVKEATGKLSELFKTLDTKEQRVKLLDFGKKSLTFAKQLPSDFQLTSNDPKVVSALVELGGAYAALRLATEVPSAEDSGFFLNTLFLADNFEQATQEFRDFLKDANQFTGYRPSITFSAVNGEIFWNHILDQFDKYVPNDHPTNFVVYRDGDKTQDRFASIKIKRADGREEIYPGDQLFRLYIKPETQITDADKVNLKANEIPLYVGDTVLIEDRTILGPLEQIVPVRRVFEVFKLVDRAAVGQAKELWEQINNNKWLTGILLTTFAGAQLTPAGPILNALMVLIGGLEAGRSFASFLREGVNAESHEELWQSAQHLTEFLAALVDIGGSSALLNVSRSNSASLVDDFDNLWRAIAEITDKFNQIKQSGLTTAARLEIGLSALFAAFKASDSAIGKLLEYGDGQVIQYLQESITPLDEGGSVLQWLETIGAKWQQVNQVAERLSQNVDVASLLSGHSDALLKVLNIGEEAVDDLAQLLRVSEITDELTLQVFNLMADDQAIRAVVRTSVSQSLNDLVVKFERLVDAIQAKVDVPESFTQGSAFASGNRGTVFNMQERNDLLIKPPSVGGEMSLLREAQSMVQLEMLDVPTVYVKTTDSSGQTVLILEKIDGVGSRSIIDPRDGLISMENAQFVTQKTIDDLERIYGILQQNNVDVGDFQFIIRRSDGAVFINDPTGLIPNRQPNAFIRTTIDDFKELLEMNNAGGN